MAEELNKCGIFTVLDLLLYFPRDYEFITVNKKFLQCLPEEKVIIECTVCNILKDIRTRSGKTLSTIVFHDGENKFKGKWFNQPYMKKTFIQDHKYMISGKMTKVGGEIYISNPKILRNISFDNNKIIAKYPLKGKLTHVFFNKIISQILAQITV